MVDGNVKSEYFQEYLKDKTKHTKDIFWRTNLDLEENLSNTLWVEKYQT